MVHNDSNKAPASATADPACEADSELTHWRQRCARLEQELHDRTARLETALAQAEQRRLEADRANAAKSLFVAHISHEIRTPLNGLLGLNDLALRVATVPAQRRYLEVALQSGQALQQVIDDLLDVSRLESGHLVIRDEPFDLADALAEVVRSSLSQLGGKRLRLRYDYLGARTWVRGDAARVRQIVGNLVDNAIKFTDQGHVQLITEIRQTGRNECHASIRVEDTGAGIAPDFLPRLFSLFEQGDPSLSRRHGGTGLGLAIARGLARAMGGEITVRSTPGEGSTFTVELPLATADDPHRLPTPAPGHVWLICETPPGGRWLQRRFERLGWSASLLFSVDEAVTSAGAARLPTPALVLVDQYVLGAGADLPALRATLPQASISLLLRPDWNDHPRERQALALAMSLMVLPLTPRDLAMMTTAAIGHLPPPTAPAPAPTPPGASPKGGHVLLVEDNAVNRLIGEEFLRALGLAVRSVENGAQAIDACCDETPALVLMDLQMPVLDGLAATRRLRAMQAEGRLAPFPIVALTAHAMGDDAAQCRDAGMDGFLTKPILLDTLKRELARWLPTIV